MHVQGQKGVKVELLQGLAEVYADLIIGMPRLSIGHMFARMEYALVKAGAVTEEELCAEHGLVPWRETPPDPEPSAPTVPEPEPEPPAPVAPAAAAIV